MNLLWTPVAVADMRWFLRYLSQTDLNAALKLLDRLERTVGDLASISEMGKYGIVAGTRECAIPGSTYFLVYRVVEGSLQILSVRDGEMWIPPDALE